MPQFLPHPHLALEHLIAAIEDHIADLAAASPDTERNITQSFERQPEIQAASSASPAGVPFPSLSRTKHHSGSAMAKLGFSFAFALAENEAISEAVDTLSDIIETCKNLYGVASFIQQEEVDQLGDFSSYIHTPVRSPTQSAR